MKRRTSGLIDPKNHHKIPLSPPLPKGETPVSSLWQREVGRDFRNRFQTAQGIHFLKFLFIGLLVFLVTFSCKEKAEKSSLPKIGTAAIDFSCQDLKGQTWTLEKIKGKVVLLRFWTDWCPHCRYEMPVIENYYRKLNKEGFVVLAVNVKQSSQVAEAFAAQFDVTFPILVDSDGKLAQRYGVHTIPTNFLIDRQGIVREIRVGDLLKNKNFMEGLLKSYFQK